MKIIKGTDLIDVAHPVMVIAGPPGISKSSLGYSMKDPILLDFDRGAHRAANRRDTIQIRNWIEAEEVASNPPDLEGYASIVADTVGRALDMLGEQVSRSDPKNRRSGGDLSLQGWGQLKSAYKKWMLKIQAMDKDVLLLCHDREEKDGDTRVIRPDMQGGSYGEVMKFADFVGHLYMVGDVRWLDFSPSDTYIGKNPAGWKPFEVPPMEKATDFLQKLYAKGRDHLGKMSAASAATAAEVQAWRERIAREAGSAGADDKVGAFTKMLREIDALGPLVGGQAKRILWDETRAIGLRYDAEQKTFAATTSATPPTTSNQSPATEVATPAATAPVETTQADAGNVVNMTRGGGRKRDGGGK